MEGPTGLRPRLRRRAFDQRRDRCPSRRPRVRLPLHRRRTRRTRLDGLAQSSRAAVHAAAAVVGPRPPSRPPPPARTAGARRPRAPRVHRRPAEPVRARAQTRTPPSVGAGFSAAAVRSGPRRTQSRRPPPHVPTTTTRRLLAGAQRYTVACLGAGDPSVLRPASSTVKGYEETTVGRHPTSRQLFDGSPPA